MDTKFFLNSETNRPLLSGADGFTSKVLNPSFIGGNKTGLIEVLALFADGTNTIEIQGSMFGDKQKPVATFLALDAGDSAAELNGDTVIINDGRSAITFTFSSSANMRTGNTIDSETEITVGVSGLNSHDLLVEMMAIAIEQMHDAGHTEMRASFEGHYLYIEHGDSWETVSGLSTAITDSQSFFTADLWDDPSNYKTLATFTNMANESNDSAVVTLFPYMRVKVTDVGASAVHCAIQVTLGE